MRLAHVWALRDTPWFEHLVVDPGYYDLWAQRIAAGDWFGGDRAFYMDPLYPYVLGGLYRLFGRDLLAVRLVQVAMSVGSCALVARLGTMLGGPLAGLGAGLWLALYKPEIMFTAEIEKTTLSVLLTAAGLVLFLGRSRRSRFGAGIVLGLATLTRGNLLLFAPLGALVLAREAPGRRADSAALFLAGFALALAPVLWRNHHGSGAFVPTTTQGGQNFYIGNNPNNLSGSYGALPFVRMNPAFEEEDFHAEAERRTGRSLDARATSRFWYDEALRFMREQSGTALALLARKVALVWNDYEISDNQDQYLLARDSWVMRLPLPGFGITAAFAAVGILATVATMPAVRWLLGFVVLYSASVAAFFVFSRYRIQLVPALIPLAVLGARAMVVHLREGAARRLLGDGALWAGVAAFTFQTIQPFDPGSPQVKAMQLHKLADVHLLAGDANGAIAALHEAMTACPEQCPGELRVLVALYERTGRSDEAITWLAQLVGAHPRNHTATVELERLRAANR